MPAFLARWEQLKKDLDADIQRAPAGDKKLAALLAGLQKTTGFTPVLKEVDEALKKGHRKPAVAAMMKFYALREPYARLLVGAMTQPGIDDGLMTALNDLSHALKALELDIQKAIKALQEEKGGDEAKPGLLMMFEVDLKKNIETAKKELKPLAAIDKKHEVLTLVEPAVKLMDAYSKAAARTQNQQAYEALEKFVEVAKRVTAECKNILGKEKDPAYTKAVTRFYKDLDTMCAQRVNVQLKALAKHLGV